MPGGDIYQAWANATPTTPFPFTYQDKKVGKIQQTWADVRNGIQRDAVSTSLPFCTGHITPSILQVNIISDSIKKENSFFKRWNQSDELRRSQSSLSEADASVGGSTGSLSSLRSTIRSAQEQDALLNSEGGRGRAAYLKLRRAMSPQKRYDGRVRTSAQIYGWNIDVAGETTEAQFRSLSSQLTNGSATPSAAEKAVVVSRPQTSAAAEVLSEALNRERRQYSTPLGQGVATGLMVKGSTSSIGGDHRRKNTLNQGLRSSGVFPKKE